MRNWMKLLCGFLAISGLNCGGEPLTQESKSESTPATGESELIKGIVAKRNPDRTWNHTIFYQARKEHEAQRSARLELARSAKAGGDVAKQGARLSAAPAEIGPGDCNEWDSLWLYAQMPHELLWCCVAGADVDAVENMCQFHSFDYYIGYGRGGWYANDNESCSGNWPAPNPEPMMRETYGCEASWVGQW